MDLQFKKVLRSSSQSKCYFIKGKLAKNIKVLLSLAYLIKITELGFP